MVIPYALEIGFSLVSLAYVAQLYKIFRTKRSDGIALNGYLVTFITLLSYIFWSKGTIGTAKILELILHTLTFAYIYKHATKATFSKKDLGIFIVALIGSFNLIGGIAQAYKSYRDVAPEDVSFLHYTLIFIANLFFLHVAFLEHERLLVFSGLIVTNIVYSYILFKTGMRITKWLP
ncbi:hypothetical protein [Sulfurospirillum multivorans]|uniref:Uncharacterized protein n=2 Tax=Sulfurospirillum multivorans TaxID=66821 RepID=A0AA86AQY2_SULMK|nr:hypothetical protein [Sulfurospirillum multivorans]AHJ14197.1 hypothetical protein SMUL_2961 [Sulfurospirillum multivorans DSM 12446]QEH07682.1 hypothetical protein SMN_2927 [Sulfurospirillum multivorans]